jgi:hypothetical protein
MEKMFGQIQWVENPIDCEKWQKLRFFLGIFHGNNKKVPNV